MQRLPSRGKASARPSTNSTKSFSRYEPSSTTSTPSRTRASTVQGIPIPDYAAITESPTSYKSNGDVFESQESRTSLDDTDDNDAQEDSAEVEELPDEIRELVDSFLESLGAKVHPTPLTIDQLSELFQNFYEHSQSRIDDHIATETSRYPGQSGRTPSITSSSSALSRGGGRRTLRTSLKGNTRLDSGDHQQMLTPAEVRNRRKVRKQLDHRRVVLEELVERSVCERVYPKLWRHRTTDDDARDEKLRSRAAALAVIGISLKELLSTAMHDASSLDPLSGDDNESQNARERLADARTALEAMNEERYPLGKLNHLKAAHKSIVETLQQLFPRSSSADEVLPTLIYTIITSSPDSNHIVSNFNYVQRFRNQAKIDGEAAYCLTNLEAAITFLETVDLSSIRANETPQGPVRSASGPSTPTTEKTDPLYHGIPSTPKMDSPEKFKAPKPRSRASSNATARPRGSSFLSQQRRPHDPTTPTEALREAADEAFDAMHNALDNSFKFFFGKLKERQGNAEDAGIGKVLTPKTLEDAHKLVSEKPEDDDVIDEEETARPTSRDENNNAFLRAIGGMRPRERERSADSGVSAEASRKVSVTAGSSPMAASSRSMTTPTASPHHPLGSSPPTAAGPLSAVDKLTNLGNSLNPLRGWGGVGMMRGFGGRSVSAAVGGSSVGSISSPVAPPSEREPEKKSINQAAAGQADLSGISPPIQRFVDCRDGKELNGYDVELLLRDYQRLVGALRAVGVFET